MNNIEELICQSRIKEISRGSSPLIGEKERLALTAMYWQQEHQAAVEAFQETGRNLLLAQEQITGLITQLEAAQKERDELNGILNIERGGSAFASKRTAHIDAMRDKWQERAKKAEEALSAANQPWRSFITNDDISALNRFAECCDDPESGGHDLDKDQVERLVSIGALRKTKRNYHETTDFGDFVISAGFTVEGE